MKFSPSRNSAGAGRSGFSLVEVVLAVGVVAFAFVAIMGLIPAGIHQFRLTMDNSICAQIAQRVILDCQQSDFNTLVDATNTASLQNGQTVVYIRTPSLSATQSAGLSSPGATIRYFDEAGNEIIPAGRQTNANADPTTLELNAVVYYVNTRVAISTMVPQSSAPSANAGSTDLATVVVQVVFNPGHKNLPINPSNMGNLSCLIDTTNATMNGTMVRTYNAQVGRNF